MAFVDKNMIIDTLYLTGTYNLSDKETVYDNIEIINNEYSSIDFSNISFTDAQYDIEKILIEIYGEKITLSKPFAVSNSALDQNDEWRYFEKYYNFDNNSLADNIKITFYTLDNNFFSIIIPFNIIYKNISELDVNFKLINANITNSGNVSYIFKNEYSDTALVVKSLSLKEKITSTD